MARPIGCKPIKWDIDELKRLYLDEKMSGAKIARALGLRQESVNAALRRFNIPRRSMAESHSKELHYRWNGGRFSHKQGYIYVSVDKHPRASKRGYVFEHILIVEKQLGRYLRKDETVHHLNGVKTDNRIENLVVLRQQDHNRVIPLLKQRIRELENEIKRLSQSVMRLEV